MQRGGGEWHTVFRADGSGQSVVSKEPIENGPDAHAARREQAATREQIAGVLVGDGCIAHVPVARVVQLEDPTASAIVDGYELIETLEGCARDVESVFRLIPECTLLILCAPIRNFQRKCELKPSLTRNLPQSASCLLAQAILLLLIALAGTATSAAQTLKTGGTLEGTISDMSGGRIPGGEVSLSQGGTDKNTAAISH